MDNQYPLNILEIQFLDAEGNILFRLPDPIIMENGQPAVRIKIPDGLDMDQIHSVKEILDD